MTTTSAGRVSTQALVLLGGGVALFAIPPVRHTLGHGLALLASGQLGQFQQYLRSLGAWAPAASIGLMTAEALLVPVPIAVIMVANGLVFGLWPGMLVSLAGGLTGAVTAYAIGRWLGRALVERILPPVSLSAADRLMAKYGRWAVVLERWIPGIPGDPMSYAAGLTRMNGPVFLGLTTLGLIPANLVTAFVGTEVAGDIPLPYWIGGWLLALAAWLTWRAVASARSARASTPPETRP